MADNGLSPRSQTSVYCSVCLMPFTKPRLLPCFHTFCVKCLERFVTDNNGQPSVNCPTCTSSSPVPGGDLDKLPTNDYIGPTDGDADSLKPTECDVCGPDVPAVNHCTDCKENYCERCTLTHTKMKLTKSHCFVKIASDTNSDSRKEKDQFCLVHPNGQYEFLCINCNVLICFTCKDNEHKEHNCSYINDMAVRVREQLQNVLKNAKTTIDTYRNVIAEHREKQNRISQMFQTEIDKLKTQTEDVIANIAEYSSTLEKQLKQHCMFRRQEADTNESKLTQDIVAWLSITETGHGLLDAADDNQLVTDGRSIMETIRRQRQPRKFYYRINAFTPGSKLSDEEVAKAVGITDYNNHILI